MRVPLLFALLVLYAPCSSATLVDFTLSGTDSGMIGGTAFSDVAFTIGGQFDTMNLRVVAIDVAAGPDDFTFVSIGGVGVFQFARPVTFLDDFIASVVRLQFTGTSSDAFVLAISDRPVDWEFDKPFGPATMRGEIFNWTSAAIETSGGVLVLNDNTQPITLQASGLADSPEPSSTFLVGFAILGVILLRFTAAQSGIGRISQLRNDACRAAQIELNWAAHEDSRCIPFPRRFRVRAGR